MLELEGSDGPVVGQAQAHRPEPASAGQPRRAPAVGLRPATGGHPRHQGHHHLRSLGRDDPSCCIADKGYIGTGVLTPYKKPPNSELTKAQKQANKSLNEIRYVVERTIAHIKSWKILAHDYRRPLHTFKETITATLALYAYTNP